MGWRPTQLQDAKMATLTKKNNAPKKVFAFRWHGVNRKGQKVSGELQADSISTVKAELRKLEPHIGEDAIGALHSPDAGTITPYEYTIALAENAVANGVEIRTRRIVRGTV